MDISLIIRLNSSFFKPYVCVFINSFEKSWKHRFRMCWFVCRCAGRPCRRCAVLLHQTSWAVRAGAVCAGTCVQLWLSLTSAWVMRPFICSQELHIWLYFCVRVRGRDFFLHICKKSCIFTRFLLTSIRTASCSSSLKASLLLHWMWHERSTPAWVGCSEGCVT